MFPVLIRPVQLPPLPSAPAARQIVLRNREALWTAGWGKTAVADWSPQLRCGPARAREAACRGAGAVQHKLDASSRSAAGATRPCAPHPLRAPACPPQDDAGAVHPAARVQHAHEGAERQQRARHQLLCGCVPVVVGIGGCTSGWATKWVGDLTWAPGRPWTRHADRHAARAVQAAARRAGPRRSARRSRPLQGWPPTTPTRARATAAAPSPESWRAPQTSCWALCPLGPPPSAAPRGARWAPTPTCGTRACARGCGPWRACDLSVPSLYLALPPFDLYSPHARASSCALTARHHPARRPTHPSPRAGTGGDAAGATLDVGRAQPSLERPLRCNAPQQAGPTAQAGRAGTRGARSSGH